MGFLQYIPTYYYFMLLSFVVSIFFARPEGYLRLFPYFLLVTVVVDGYGIYLSYESKSNTALYNWFTTFEFCFYLFIMMKIVDVPGIRRRIQLALILFAGAASLNILFIQRNGFHSYTYSLGCLLLVVATFYYFYNLFRSKRSVRLVRDPAFWICSGLLVYYCCSFPLIATVNFLGNVPPRALNILGELIEILNVFLYAVFTIAFLCRIRIRKYTLSS